MFDVYAPWSFDICTQAPEVSVSEMSPPMIEGDVESLQESWSFRKGAHPQVSDMPGQVWGTGVMLAIEVHLPWG